MCVKLCPYPDAFFHQKRRTFQMKAAKKIVMSLVIVTLLAVLCIGSVSIGASSGDPADIYVKQT